MARGKRHNYDSPTEFIEYLEETLIPDLKEARYTETAKDFEEAIYWIVDGMGIFQGGFERRRIATKQKKSKRKKPQSKKQKILTEMTDKKWKKYSKGSGKKTYFEIRSQVSRSQVYKKRVKNL